MIRQFQIICMTVCLAVASQSVFAVPYGGIEFPQGAISFADVVVSYEPLFGGGPGPTSANFMDPDAALGIPDYSGTGAVSLGRGGRITLQFTNNKLTGSGDALADLHIFEIGPDVEDTFVEISMDNVTWHAIGKVFGATSSIDIDAFGFGLSDEFGYVRLRDDPAEGGIAGATVGADIDAVGAISTVATPVPEPGALALTGLGLLLVAGSRIRQRRT